MTILIPLDKGLTSKQIVACTICDSTGIKSRSELTDYHRGDYDYWNEFCSFCEGEGRVLELTHHSRVKLALPNGKTSSHSVESKYREPLNGRKTQDIYKIGRDA